jgi:voltage-gated potassium channel
MEHLAQSLKDHYIVCGLGLVGTNIVNELRTTRRPCVVIDISAEKADLNEKKQFEVLIEGDATDDDTLNKAGIASARGLFAVTSDDNMNLVICLTAKHLNPNLRIVSQCNDLKNSDKLKHAGADAVVSPVYIGGLRMASEMVRPTVVTFLDRMLRDSGAGLRVEEMAVPESLAGKKLGDLGLKRFREALLLAATGKDGWTYNPDDEYRLAAGSTLVFMTTAAERIELAKVFQMTTNRGASI